MSKIKLLGLSSLFVSSSATAAPACSGFELVIKNKSTDDLFISIAQLSGAEISPIGLKKIDKNATQVFVVNNSKSKETMSGEFNLHTISIPSKDVKIKYSLSNSWGICKHTQEQVVSDFNVGKTRSLNKVTYTITP